MTGTRVVALLMILPFAAGGHRLTCPQTIDAAEGDDVIIRCGLDPPVDLSAYTLDVARERDDHGYYDNDVHSYRNGKDQPDDQMDGYRGRTTLNHEDLIRGNVTLKISSVTLSDSGKYIVFLKNLAAPFVINITVVSKDQANRTKRNDSSTSGPPVEEETESDHRGGSAKEESVWKIVVPSVCVAAAVVVVVVLLLLLVKCGVIQICKKTNNFTMRYLRPPTTEEDGDPHSAAEHGVRGLVVRDDTQSSPQP